MELFIAGSEQTESETPLIEFSIEATRDSISVNLSVGSVDIPPPLKAEEPHHDGVHRRFSKFLRRSRSTQPETDTPEAEADPEPAPRSRENSQHDENSHVGIFPAEGVENITLSSREATEGETITHEGVQALKKLKSPHAFLEHSATNTETQKDELPPFFATRCREFTTFKGS